MKNLLLLTVFAGSLLAGFSAYAGDDVYDDPSPKKQKVQKTTPQPTSQEPAPTQYPVSSSTERTSPSFGDNNYSGETYYDEEDYNTSFSGSYSYSDRIRNFHNPSVFASASYGGYYGGMSGYYGNSYYDPYANNGWYTPGYNQNYWFTPPTYWNYYNFWNPFSTTVVVITSPWQNNYGWCNNSWSNFGWNNNWYSSWYNPYYNPYNNWWTPTCHNIVNNNWGYDYGYRNTTYTPRTGTSTNSHNYTNPQRNSTNSNYQYQYTKPANNGHDVNKQQKTIAPKNYSNDNNDSYYKPQQQNNSNPNFNSNNSGNNNNNSNNSGSRQTESGIKVTKKPK